VLRALEIDADIVIKATKVDGVYDRDPMLHPEALKYQCLTYDDVLRKGLRVMDAAGIALAKEDNLPIMVLDMAVAGNIKSAAIGDSVGTLITA
jgi:uridylate kinase